MIENLVADELVAKLDKEWTGPVVREPDVSKVRAWLKLRDASDIRLYLDTFEKTLKSDYPARASLLREELERREKPKPDRVKQILVAIRGNWIGAVVILLVVATGGLFSFKEAACGVSPNLPFLCIQGEQTIEDIFGGK